MCASACFGASCRRFERSLDLAADALRECLDDRNALRVAAQRVSLPVVSIGVLRLIALQALRTCCDFLKQLKFFLVARLQIVRIDSLRLVGNVDAVEARLGAQFRRCLKIAAMKRNPCIDDGVVLRKRFGIAPVQPIP